MTTSGSSHGGHDDHDHDDHDHDDHSGHDDHGHHDHSHDFRDASRRSLLIALALITTYMVAEVIGGLLSGSLALLADAGHMLTDAAAIVMALIAIWIAQRPASVERTFGYHRTEILAALANTFSLWIIAAWIIFEAYHRAFVEVPDINGWPVLIVGFGGLVINLAAAWILHSSSEHSVNVEGALQHVIADLLGSVAVVISAILILTLSGTVENISIVDPILSVIIALLIVWNTRHLIVRITNVLLEGAPEHIDVFELCYEIEEVEGVTLMHDVHVWTINQGNEAFTAHILMDPSYHEDAQSSLEEIKRIVHRHGIGHVTIQLERSVAECTEFHHVGHLEFESRAARRLG
jgi:cobalt-zinc-cadmium efflux system protein